MPLKRNSADKCSNQRSCLLPYRDAEILNHLKLSFPTEIAHLLMFSFPKLHACSGSNVTFFGYTDAERVAMQAQLDKTVLSTWCPASHTRLILLVKYQENFFFFCARDLGNTSLNMKCIEIKHKCFFVQKTCPTPWQLHNDKKENLESYNVFLPSFLDKNTNRRG